MNIFEVVGPVMVGPSSSHTAGAVKIGYISGRLLGSLWCGQRSTCMAPFLRPGTDTVRKKRWWQDF